MHNAQNQAPRIKFTFKHYDIHCTKLDLGTRSLLPHTLSYVLLCLSCRVSTCRLSFCVLRPLTGSPLSPAAPNLMPRSTAVYMARLMRVRLSYCGINIFSKSTFSHYKLLLTVVHWVHSLVFQFVKNCEGHAHISFPKLPYQIITHQ